MEEEVEDATIVVLKDAACTKELLDVLAKHNVDKLDEFGKLLHSCNLKTVGAIRLFQDSLPMLVQQMYDVNDTVGSLQCKGFLAIVMVRTTHTLIRLQVDVMCAITFCMLRIRWA